MMYKCQSCGKWFKADDSLDEFCPYCGQVLPQNKRNKLRKSEYFLRVKLKWIIVILIMIIFIFLCL